MSKDRIKNLSLFSALVGIFLILLVKDNLVLPTTDLQSLQNVTVDQKVKTSGTISYVSQSKSGYYLVIKNQKYSIPIMIFTQSNLTLSKDQIIEVEGRITEFNKKRSLIADQVWV
ncbi:hypothetical protein CL622_05150 [archaeon]|nr:hypothetical protein [archaeon]|tara:strand:- start:102 stop:446 length:345 start_codon:yes stop_codon:yes gene_type:complete